MSVIVSISNNGHYDNKFEFWGVAKTVGHKYTPKFTKYAFCSPLHSQKFLKTSISDLKKRIENVTNSVLNKKIFFNVLLYTYYQQ